MSDADLERKFLRLCELVLGQARSERIIEAVWSLTAPDKLFAELQGGGRR